MPRKGLGAEHPLNDRAQFVFVLAFFIVWGLDSFVLRYSTMLGRLISFYIAVPIGVVSFILGAYFVRKSEAGVFSQKEAKVIDTGVYGWVRHPMYFGTLLILLAFTMATLSILSFIIWVAFFIFLDRMATYEEKDLIKMLGQLVIFGKNFYTWLDYPSNLRC
jgi:protein-S-isoprenylcysteine O-methyltransferase Ste14